MTREQECELCGVVVADAEAHRRFHEEIASWIHLIELEVEARMRAERRNPRGDE